MGAVCADTKKGTAKTAPAIVSKILFMCLLSIISKPTQFPLYCPYYTCLHTCMSMILSRAFRISIYIFATIGLFFVLGFVAVKFGLTNTKGIIDQQNNNFLSEKKEYVRFPLAHTPEWVAFRQAVAKDKSVIERVSKETGVPPRLLVALLVPEQMRLFYSNRPIFKEIFGPLKILGAQSQFSWGIMGLKDDTAREIERRLKDSSSPSYLGTKYEHLLDFETADMDQERFTRIVDEHDHYYAYLYAALFLKEIEREWESAGFPIDNRPEILATLYNIGFAHSKPHANPQPGGAEIDIDGTIYSFGSLAGSFYYSDEMVELFPEVRRNSTNNLETL